MPPPRPTTRNQRPLPAIGARHCWAPWIGNHFQLTERELNVPGLIFQEKTRREIAGEWLLARGTLRGYIDRLFDKLLVTDRLGMALRIMQAYLAGSN